MVSISDVKARNIKPDDKPISDGAVVGLRLEPGAARGRGKWIMRYVSPASRKRRDFGLGAYPDVSIAEARRRALDARKLIIDGQDPIDARKAQRAADRVSATTMTFEKAGRAVYGERKSGWKNPKHSDQWINTLNAYVFPKIGGSNVADLTPADFAEVLRPIWLTKPETASRVKQRCHAVMKWCWAHGLVHSNPLDVVDYLLPAQPSKRERTRHHPALPWRDLPAFTRQTLRNGPSNPTRALLEFLILTAARSQEARAMTWSEVDLENKIWAIPAARMKAKSDHRIPLSGRAVEILESQRRLFPDSTLVFPSPRGLQMSDSALTKFLKDREVPSDIPGRFATAHGFRSTFRDWASEHGYSRDLAERALAHTISNQAEAAYHRTDLLEQRRGMMEAWAQQIITSSRKTV